MGSDNARAGPFRRLLIATTNPGKLKEIRPLLTGLLLTLETLEHREPITAPRETGSTFAENARVKALHYAALTGLSTIAEDAGLEVEALDGEPGVHSARYGGAAAPSYADKFDLLYRRLRQKGVETSKARFVCAVALADRGQIVYETSGSVEGEISAEPRGRGGFGYDPIFYYPPYARTLAEVSEEEKALVSHRGQAFRKILAYLESLHTV